jgi:TP901 family phage tail tape measure protein
VANIELNIVALGDFTSVNDAIKKLQLQVAALNNSLSGATGASFDKATASVKSLSTEFGNALTASGAFSRQTVKLQTETEKFGAALQKGTLSASSYYQILTRQQGAATDSVKALALEQTKLQNSIVMSDPSKKGLYSVLTPNSINQISNATKIATNEQNLYNIALDASSNKLINWGKNTQWAGRQLTVGLAMPLLLFGQQALSSFNSVNKELTQFAKVYGEGLTAPDQTTINQMSDQVLKLGKNMAATMGISLEFTTQVATQFAAMGKMGGDLTTAVEQTDRLAKLGNLDQATATNAVIALQNVYKLNTTQLADAVNYFGAVQKQTSLSMSDLVQAESRVGPVIDQLGGSYKDTAVMVLAMKEAGVPAARSANALKSAMASIIAPTSAATKEFASFGINLGAIKNAGGPVQMILALQKALDGLQPLAKQQLIEKLFGKYQFGNITALIDNLGKAGSQTANAMAVAAASTDQIKNLADQEIKQATSSPSAQWAKALATFKADLYPIGQDIMKVATKLLDFGNKVAAVFQGLPGPVKFFLGLLAGLTVLAGPIIMLTGLMANFVGNILKGVIFFKDLISGGKSIRELLTPQLIAAQNASSLFADGIKGDVDEINLLTQAITDLTEKLSIMKAEMNVGAGIDGLKAAVGATAQVETSIFSQMALPGFAEGGIIRGPGTGKSDSILARVSNGETILTEEQTRKNAGVIADIISGKHIPGYKDGLNNLDWSSVEAHTKGNFGPGTPQYEDYLKKNPGIKNPEDSVKLTSDQTATLPSWLNLRLRAPKKINKNSGVNKEDFSAGWDHMQGSQFVNTASRHGVSSSDMEDPEVRKALKDLADGVKNRVMSIDKERVLDEDLAKATKDQIESMKNGTAAERKVAAAIEKAGSTVGQARVNIGTKAVREGVQSGDYTVTNKDGQFSGQEAIGKTGIVRNSDGTAVARISGKSTGGTRVADAKDDTVSSGNWLNPNLEAKAAKKVYSQLEENLANSLNQESQSHSPSEKTNKAAKNMVDGAVEGLKAGKAPVREAVQDELMLSSYQTPDLTPQVGPRMANGGFYSGEIAPGIMGDAESMASGEGRFGKIKDRVKGFTTKENGKLNMQTKMAGSTAIMLGGSLLQGMLPKGSNVSNITGSMSSMAGMGMAFGPWGAAAGAALGLVTGGIGALMKAEKEHQATVKATFTASASTISLFGGTFKETSATIIHFTDDLKSAGITSNKAQSDIDKLSNAISKLGKDDPTRKVADSMKSYGDNSKAVIGTLKQYAAAQVAAGMDPNSVKNMVAAMLQETGQTKFLGAALKEIIPATKDVGTAQATLISKLLTTSTAMGASWAANHLLGGSYKDLNSDSKNLADGLNTVAMTMTTADATTQSLTAAAAALNNKNMDAYTSGTLLAASLRNAGQNDLADKFTSINNVVKNTGDAFVIAAAEAHGFKVTQEELVAAGNDPKKLAAITAGAEAAQVAWAKAQKKMDANIAAALGNTPGANGSTGSTAVFSGTKEEKAMEKLLTTNLGQQNAQLKVVKNQLSEQQKISSEIKAQLNYTQQINSLQTSMKTAMISGNYLEAATLKQQISGAKVDFNASSVSQKLQNQADVMQTNADAINTALSDLKDAIANNVTQISGSVSAASRLKTVNATAVSSGIAAGAPTVTTIVNVTGTVDSTSTTSSHPGVKPLVKSTNVKPMATKVSASKTSGK